MLSVGLVSCSKQKLDRRAPARQLYSSDLFQKAAGYAAATYDLWFILSARHGLVAPDQPLDPYDCTLAELSADQRRRWAEQVAAELHRRELEEAVFYLHAGRLYRQHLEQLLACTVLPFGRPLGIGEQKAWYLSQLPGAHSSIAVSTSQSRPRSPFSRSW